MAAFVDQLHALLGRLGVGNLQVYVDNQKNLIPFESSSPKTCALPLLTKEVIALVKSSSSMLWISTRPSAICHLFFSASFQQTSYLAQQFPPHVEAHRT